MTHIVTLIAGPATSALRDDMIESARAALPAAKAVTWLDHGRAADISFTPERGADQRAIARRLRELMGTAAVDVVVQPATRRRKKLLVADMDSTMIGQECIDELADFAGLRPRIASITERAMRGEIAFEPALRERVALLKELPVSAIDDVIAKRITPSPGARILVATMQKHGAHTCLVTGGFSLFAQPVAAIIGFEESHANTLLIKDGKLTGEVEEPVLGREAKLDTLLELSRHLQLPLEDTMAVGDGANDLSMIERAGLGVAYHAKPALAEAAHARIDHGDLTALLYAQGYRKAEFADA